MSSEKVLDSNRLEDKPILMTLTEVALSVVTTFSPFILASLPVLADSGENALSFGQNFYDFFSSGEAVLPLFATCGIILSLVAIFSYRYPRHATVLPLIIIPSIILFAGLVLGKTQAFSEPISQFAFWGLWMLYGLLVSGWAYLRFLSLKEIDYGPSSDEKAKRILMASQSRRRQSNGD